MSIHIPHIFLHGHGHGHGPVNNTNYLVNKHASNLIEETSTKQMNFKFDEDTSSYFYTQLSNILNNKNNESTGNIHHENIIVSNNSDDAVDTNDTNNENDDNICLITKDKLQPNHITLNCKHKFNYVPLYHEVVNQKHKQNNIYETTKLLTNEIKCPYCRAITYKLLPYIPYPSVKVIKNVNSYINSVYNSKPEFFLYAPKCSHNNTQIQCQKYGVYYEKENQLLCPQHYKAYLLKQKTGIKKIAKKSVKGVANVVCDTGTENGCCAILKSGKNIGKKCGIDCVSLGNGNGSGNGNEELKYCKKHYKLYCKT